MAIGRSNWEYSVDPKTGIKKPTVFGSIVRGAQSLVSSGAAARAAEQTKARQKKQKEEIEKQTN